MPDPKADIKKLSAEAPQKIVTEEIKRNWLEEDPTRSPDSFDKLNASANPAPDFSAWKSSVEDNISLANSCAEKVLIKIPEVKVTDRQRNKTIDFQGPGEQLIYNSLVNQFNDRQFDDQQFSDKAPYWLIPLDAGPAWNFFVGQAKEQVQRNATQLSVAFGTVFSLVTEEIPNSNSIFKTPKDWQGSNLYTNIVKLEGNLKEWDKFIGSYASLSPDRSFMTKLADDCAKGFADFANDHAALYKGFTGADGEPLYLKYQLLATARAIADKVASQFAARATSTPSYSAMYELSTSIPIMTSKGYADAVSRDLVNYDSLDVAWREILKPLGHELRRKDQAKYVALNDFFTLIEGKTVVDPEYSILVTKSPFQDSLEAWSNYNSSGPQDYYLQAWQSHTENIALLLRKCKKAVNEILQEPQFSGIREKYQIIFDAFTLNIQSGLLLCLNLT